MSTKLHITEIEAYDESGHVVFRVKVADSMVAEVTLVGACHTDESWRELAEDVGRAIKMMELDKA